MSVAACRLSLVVMRRGYPLVAICRLLIVVTSLLEHRLLQLWPMQGLAALQHLESSQTRDQTHLPCTGRWIPNHRTTRNVPNWDISERATIYSYIGALRVNWDL